MLLNEIKAKLLIVDDLPENLLALEALIKREDRIVYKALSADEALSLLLSALKNKAIDKRADLTEDEENAVVLREIKQCQESIEQANGREDIIAENTLRMKVYQEFAPKMMSEDEVEAEVTAVLAELGLDAPTAKQKGLIMKTLMPRVKGKADGALVQNVLARHLA